MFKIFEIKQKTFATGGKERIQIIAPKISSHSEEAYCIAGIGYTELDGEIQAGYKINLSGRFTKFWRNNVCVECNVSFSVGLDSNPIRKTFEKGIIGGGVFESKTSLDVEISVEPWIVRDVVKELRRNPNKGIRIDGYCLSEKVFRVAYFLLFDTKD